MVARRDGQPRADKGRWRKYASLAEKTAARREQQAQAKKRYREKHRDRLREKNAEYRKANSKLCVQRTRKWQEENVDRVRDYVYKRKYGITLDQYNAMVAERDGCCDICGKKRQLVVDHCHDTLAVRGLLCDRCNVGLGCFGDDSTVLLKAIAYLAAKGDPDFHDSWHDLCGYSKLVADTLTPR